MGAEQQGGLDDLLMGNVAEGSEETSEQIAARITASQARLAAVQKDEATASGHDVQLAKVIKTLPIGLLRFAAWMVDQGVPSFTILAIMSLSNARAEKFMADVWDVVNPDDLSFLSDVHNKKIRSKLSIWALSIIYVDRQSTTMRLNLLKKSSVDHAQFAGGLRVVIEDYLLRYDAAFEPAVLDRLARDVAGWVCVK